MLFWDLILLIFPFLVALIGISTVLKWCHKADSISDGFAKVLTFITNFLKEDSPIQTSYFPYYLDYSFLKNFNSVGETFFRKFIFSDWALQNNCEVVRYIIQGPIFDSGLTEMIAMEFRNFLMETENLHATVIVEVWAHSSANVLSIYFALNESGVNWLNQQRANTVSRQISMDSDLELTED